MNKRYYFCGIGGNGMSPLARLLAARGADVIGSDRSYDQRRNLPFFERLISEGVRLAPQDGSGVDGSIDQFVVTRAVEDSIPDVRRARELGLRVQKRPLLMADLFAETRNIAVGGTGGKSSTVGMIGWILDQAGLDPTIMNGAVMLNYGSNVRAPLGQGSGGQGRFAVFEADESDGLNDVVGVCRRDIAVLTNISLDHFELDELHGIFTEFVRGASEAVVLNADCPHSTLLKGACRRVITFGADPGADVSPASVRLQLQLPGSHNIANALAAVAACSLLGVAPLAAAEILAGFKGIQRRLELVGEVNGVRVVDDFASNPGKIAAALRTLSTPGRRLIVVFQPHGFQPTKMMRQGYVEAFSTLLRPDDWLLMPEIYYAGGSVNLVDGRTVPLPKDISSRDLIEAIKPKREHSYYFQDRSQIPAFLRQHAAAGDTIVVMGSRDETLPDFARSILAELSA